ncbi:hypothetical protein ACET3Z_001829 [Daucus carota]
MAEDDPMGIGKEALQNGASYFIQKPLSPFDVAYLWQHIVHRTSIIPDNAGKWSPNCVGYTTAGVPYVLNELNTNIAQNAMIENVITNTGRLHVAGQNGGFQMGVDQMTPTNVYWTGSLQIPNLIPDQEASGDLGGGMYFDGNTGNVGNIRTRTDQVAAVGNQIFLGGEQLILENGYSTCSLQVPNLGYINTTGQCTSGLDNTIEEELTMIILLKY